MICKNCGKLEEEHYEGNGELFCTDSRSPRKQFIPLIPEKYNLKVTIKDGKEKDPKQVKKGKANRLKGARFELKVRKDLESKGWIVDKWTNNVEFDPCKEGCNGCGNMHPARSNRFNMRSTGFPDFIAFKVGWNRMYEVIAVEVKTNGTLRKEEKEKCSWYLDNNTFSKILIASKPKFGMGGIVYKEFELKSTSVKTEFERGLKK